MRKLLIPLVALLFVTAADSAEQDFIPGYNGGYHQHDANWPGSWIPQEFPACCGKLDCEQVPENGVVTNLDGSFTIKETGERLAWNDPKVLPSRDGTFWRCKNLLAKNATRCLFVPPQGM